jgi:hypothetical protein
MKLFARTLLLLTVIFTLAIYFWWKPNSRSPAGLPAAQELTDANVATSLSVLASPVGAPATPEPPPTAATNFDWTAVESSDYKQYIVNLRALGVPEEGIRALIIADMNQLYEPREAALRTKPAPDDQSAGQRWDAAANPDVAQLKQLRQVQMEKQANLKELLGTYIPRELLRMPAARNYDALEYALAQLPDQKHDAVQTLVEDFYFAHDLPSGPGRFVSLSDYVRLCEQRDQGLQQILTPEEFKQYTMNTTPAGTELARCVAGMSPTDAEFAAMFDIKYDNWTETGGVYGRWRARKVPPEEIAAADQRMDESLQAALGPERFLDYQLAATELGQELHNLGDRYDLSRSTLSQAYAVQKQLDDLKALRERAQAVQIPDEVGALQQKLQTILGPQVWQAWHDYRSLRPGLQP